MSVGPDPAHSPTDATETAPESPSVSGTAGDGSGYLRAGIETTKRRYEKHAKGLTHSQRRGIQRRTLYAERVLVGGRLVHPRAEHGLLSSYQNYGCRCVPCSAASHSERADRYSRYARLLSARATVRGSVSGGDLDV